MLTKRLALLLIVLLAAVIILDIIAPEHAARFALRVERERAGLQRHEIDWQGRRIAYLVGGQGETLLLLHGFGADKDHFARFARYLTDRFRVIIPDMPGFGESERLLEEPFGIDAQIGRLRHIVEAFGLERFHIGGSSMGGRLAVDYAARFPKQIRTILLLSPSGIEGSLPEELSRAVDKDNPLLPRSRSEWDRMVEFTMERPPFIPGSLRRMLGERANEDYNHHRRIFHEVANSSPLNESARGLAMPTLIVWGDKDRALNVSAATTLLKLMPDARAEIYKGVGHLPMIEQPRRTAQDYKLFIDSLGTG